MKEITALTQDELDRALAHVDGLNGKGELKEFGFLIGCSNICLLSVRTRQSRMTQRLALRILQNIDSQHYHDVRFAETLPDSKVD
jgi:hypothetical protein